MNSQAVSASAPVPPPGRLPALTLGAATFLFWVSLYLYVPFLPGYSRSLGATATWIGLITGSYGLAQLLLRWPAGIWSDRLGRRKPFVLAGCAFSLFSALAFAAAGGPAGLLLARTLAGVAATTWLAFTVLYTSYFPASRGQAMAIVVFLNHIGILAGQVLGPMLAGGLGPERVFWRSAAVGGAALALAALAPDRRLPQQGGPTLGELLRVAGHRQVLTVSLLAAVIQYLIHGGSFVFVYDWAQQQLGATATDLGTLSLYRGLPTAVATLAGGTWLLRRWGHRRVITGGFLISGLAMAAVPLSPNLTVLQWSQSLGGVAQGLTTPLLMSLALQAVPPEQGATAVGFFQATYSLGMTAGPFLTGLIADTAGAAGGFWLMVALTLVGAASARYTLPGGG